MKNPLTYLNSLFDAFAEQTLCGHDQLIMLHIFNKFNRSHWAETVRISDRELQELCRLYDSTGKQITIDTIRNAKSRLKLKGLIDFKAGKGKSSTEYRIVNPSDTPSHSPQETPSDTPSHSSRVSYIRACEDNKDFKTLDRNNSTITSIACAGACVNRDFENAEIDKIVDYWEESRFGKLDFELTSKLEVYVKKYGYSEVKAAMDSAKESNGSPYGVSFAYFASVLENRNKPKLKVVPKGGEKVEQSADARAKWAYSD